MGHSLMSGRRVEADHVIPDCRAERVMDSLPRGARAYATRDPGLIDRLVIHHSAAPGNLPVERVAIYHVRRREWPGIGYHYYITADGAIYWCNWLETVSWHCGGFNQSSVGICLAGDFRRKGSRPTGAQLVACHELIEALRRVLGPAEVYGHKELAATICPGAGWVKSTRAGWRRHLT